MITQDFKTSPFKRAAIVKAKIAKRQRNAKLATILVNVVGSLVGALCLVYSIHVVLG